MQRKIKKLRNVRAYPFEHGIFNLPPLPARADPLA